MDSLEENKKTAAQQRAIDSFKESFFAGLKPAPIMTVSEWSDSYRMLPQKTSAEPGQWRTSRTPYLRELMDELSHMSKTKEVVFMKGAQVGGTEAGNNFLGYIVDYMPGTAMVVWPALPDVKKNSKLRIDPLFEDTPRLKEKVNTGNAKDKNNTALFKGFDGGALILTGANSASGLRSVPARFLFLDEIDGYPEDVEGEGDPIKLVEARTRTFARRKILKVSTPTIKGSSKIEREFKASDQRYYNVPCPHCNEFQKLDFENLEYKTIPGDEHDFVTECSYFCPKCGEEIEEFHKTKMLTNGKWIAENPESEVAGFHLNALYSPLGWYSWREIAQDWVEAQDNPDKMVSFVNTVKGETYEETGERPEEEKLYQRRELYDIGTVPNKVLFLTCAVDVQGDRLEAEVIGWGRWKERWSIDRKVIPGSPQDEQTWNDLEDYLGVTFPRDDGREMPIRICGIDSGYETNRVYTFCRKFDHRRVIPLKGDPNNSQIVGTPKALDVKENGKSIRRGIKLWKVGVNLIKSEVYGDLKKEPPMDLIESYPAGFIHFPQYEMEYFLQLTAEQRKVERDNKGYNKIIWIKKRERNETLDLHVYNRALASIVGIDRMKEEQYLKLEANLGVVSKLKKKDTDNSVKTRKRRKKRKEGSWI